MPPARKFLVWDWCLVLVIAGSPLVALAMRTVMVFPLILVAVFVLPALHLLMSVVGIISYGKRLWWRLLLPMPIAFGWLGTLLWVTRNGPNPQFMWP